MHTSALDMEQRTLLERYWDLRARVKLSQLAAQAESDAEAFTILMHAELYLQDRTAYEANRLGVLRKKVN